MDNNISKLKIIQVISFILFGACASLVWFGTCYYSMTSWLTKALEIPRVTGAGEALHFKPRRGTMTGVISF